MREPAVGRLGSHPSRSPEALTWGADSTDRVGCAYCPVGAGAEDPDPLTSSARPASCTEVLRRSGAWPPPRAAVGTVYSNEGAPVRPCSHASFC